MKLANDGNKKEGGVRGTSETLPAPDPGKRPVEEKPAVPSDDATVPLSDKAKERQADREARIAAGEDV